MLLHIGLLLWDDVRDTFEEKKGKEVTGTDSAIRAMEMLDKRIAVAKETERKVQDAIRELRSEVSAAASLKKELKTQEDALRHLAEEFVTEVVETELERQLKVLGEKTEEQMRKSVQKVISEFDMLRDVLMGSDGTNPEKKTIPQLVEDLEKTLSLKWEAFMSAVRAASAVSKGCSDQECRKEPEWAVLALIELPDGRRGESHFHMCAEHKERLKTDPDATVLRTQEIVRYICPWDHQTWRMFREDGQEKPV